MKVEEENRDFYRKPENFINAIVFEVVKEHPPGCFSHT